MKYVIATLLLLSQCIHAEELDYGRTCLALVGYSEARSDGYVAMVEVERVVINRLLVDDHSWGSDICSVANGLNQFLGVQNWPTPRQIREDAAWQDALKAADAVIATQDTSACAGALYFSQVRPKVPLCKIGRHYFYKLYQ